LAAASQGAPGSVVTVTLQASSAPVLAVVPDVSGLSFGDANAAVASAGLVLRATGPRTGIVQSQTPSWDAGPARIHGVGHPDRLNLPTNCSFFCSAG
jgi:hypothetical protein